MKLNLMISREALLDIFFISRICTDTVTIVVNHMKTMEVILEKIKIQKVHASFLYSVYFCIHDFWKGAIKLMCLSRRYID